MKRYVKANNETTFWDLHDSEYEVGTKLEEIIDELGWGDRFFPEDGEPTADENDYRIVLREYYGFDNEDEDGDHPGPVHVKDVVADLASTLRSYSGIKHADWEEEIDALRFTLDNGRTYQLVLQDLGKNM